ncbi:hypothetical protein HMPREF0765_1234 [Sphingobacterium spiritivorum ATCC 33300]|uniref:Uncharacterized protein n=1 Tax=Sphingobacterium spiritivorum ATCC 33300 TaxID=525372 RepID=C2FV78_SPHSI|nr:hypothetical protein HMPREF0765_1234 [Sphingobacterium spiritivorum ATCC 33300]
MGCSKTDNSIEIYINLTLIRDLVAFRERAGHKKTTFGFRLII